MSLTYDALKRTQKSLEKNQLKSDVVLLKEEKATRGDIILLLVALLLVALAIFNFSKHYL